MVIFSSLRRAAGDLDVDDLAALAAHQGLADRATRGRACPRRGWPRRSRRAGTSESPVFWSLTWTLTPTATLLVSRSLASIDGRAAEPLLHLRDPLLEHRLLVLGVVVLGVLGDVAELARLLDPLGDLAPARRLQLLELRLELLEPFGCDQGLSRHVSNLLSVLSAERPETRPQRPKTPDRGPPLGCAPRARRRGTIATGSGRSRTAVQSGDGAGDHLAGLVEVGRGAGRRPPRCGRSRAAPAYQG